MKRIGSPPVLFWICCICLGLTASSFAQSNINVEASVSQSTVFTGEVITLSVKVSGDFNNVSRPTLPDFQGFRLLSNNPSTSRSYSYVNGESSTSYSYTYSLVAQDRGTFRIPPVSITIDNREYKTRPIEVSITDRNESAKSNDPDGTPEIFLEMEMSDRRPVPGQQLLADLILYFKEGLEVTSYQPVPGWKAEGFWKEELKSTERPRAESTILNGVRYRKARLLQFALFPTKTGPLTISPYAIVITVRAASSGNDPFSSFFGGFGRNQRQVELKTDPEEIDVRPLPELSRAAYIGAVGSFDISRVASTEKATVGESIEITTRVEGTGNIPLITKPDFDLPDGLEVYEPREKSALDRSNQQISGSKTFTDIVIARSPGTYTIPSRTLAFYNPARNRYIRRTLPAITLTVARAPEATAGTDPSPSFNIRPITGLASWQTPSTTSLYTYWWFWVGLTTPLLILGLAFWQKRYRDRMNNDIAFARSRNAYENAAQKLEKALQASENGHEREAYNLLQKAVTGFISDRLNLPEAGLPNEGYVDALRKRGVDDNLVKNVRMLLDKCSSISYAPDTPHEYLKSHVGLAQSIIDKLKKEL